MKRTIHIFLIILIIFFSANPVLAGPDVEDVDINILHTTSEDRSIELESQGALLMGLQNGEILLSKNADKRLYPASTTKILTALLALENGDLNEIITIGNEANLCPYDSSKAGIDIEEEISLENLLYGLMLPSGNDAAYAIAVHIGRKINGDPDLSIDKALLSFVNLMNNRARDLGAKNSHFVTPDGYHDDQHYTTAYDMALIAKEAMNYDIFRKIVSTTMFTIPDWSSARDHEATDKEIRYWRNSNDLIQPKKSHYYPDATGIKTGYTSKANYCLVSSASRNDIELLTVILGSTRDDKWNDTITLFEYGFNNYIMYKPFSQGQQVEILDIANNPVPDWVRIIVDKTSVHLVPKDQLNNIQQVIEWDTEIVQGKGKDDDQFSLDAPIPQYQKVGTLALKLDNKVLDKIDLLTSKEVELKEKDELISPIKIGNGIDTSLSTIWNGYSFWQKVGLGITALALTFIIFTVFLAIAIRRNRKRYRFRRRY